MSLPSEGSERRPGMMRASDAPVSARQMGPGIVVLSVTGFLALCVAYMASAAIPGVAGRVVADMAFVVPLVLSVLLCSLVFIRTRGVEARFWLLGAALNGVLLVSELYYLWWVVATGGPPPAVYAPFQIMHIVVAGLFYALLAVMSQFSDATAIRRARWALDIGSVAVALYVALLVWWIEPLLAGVTGATDATRLVATVYPTWGVLMVAGVIWSIATARQWRAWERMITVSLLIYAVGVTVWPLWYVAFQGSTADGAERSLLDLVLVLGHLLFTIAAAQRLTPGGRAWPFRHMRSAHLGRERVIDYLAVAVGMIALPVMLWVALLPSTGGLERMVCSAGSGLLALLIVGRMVVDAVESGRLFHRAVTDPLTGLYNHRHFHERLGVELEAADRFGDPLSVIVLDVDDLESINRTAGHHTGDEVLKNVALALRRGCGAADAICRVAGDEFAVIMHEAGAAGALGAALRVQNELRALPSGLSRPVTVSAGIACFPAHATSPDRLVELAEGATYWSKQHGKDHVLVYDPATVADLSAEERVRAIESRTQLGTVRALAAAVDARHEHRRLRSTRVAALAADLATRLGLSDDSVRLVETAALIHDVGMVALPDALVGKPGPLDDEEMEQVRRHPVLSTQIAGATMPDIAVPWIRHHHERWDGRGYPDGLRAVAIPREARMIAVCDAWAAMTSGQPYRAAMTPEEAAAELERAAGTQFDPAVVEVFLQGVRKAPAVS